MDTVVVAVAVVLTGLLGWYFFGPRETRRAEVEQGAQVLTVTVKGGVQPGRDRSGAGCSCPAPV